MLNEENIESQLKKSEVQTDSDNYSENPDETNDDINADSGKVALAVSDNTNVHLRRLISYNYMEYTSYVIKERAIPDINDGLKPVQRRILWSLYRMDDGKFNKVANIVGHTMQYHPHGDSSIYQALVHLANKEYFIERQGNFGNILTGDSAAAARYIEARLTPLAKETIFNTDITDFTESYDGRNQEPIFFPAKIPILLMTGQMGIAPGMTTMILPHNFKELLEAQISILKNENFELYPDFIQGGLMNVTEYEDGNGKITLRSKIDIDGRKLIIREIPASTNTEKLITSIEKAVTRGKIKITSINDFTTEKIEIEIVPARGYSPEKTLKALYAYTDCSVSLSLSLLVIKNNRPVIMTVSDVLRHNTDTLVFYLRRELEIELERLNEKYHEKTLERIFIENRIYKRIEECDTYILVLEEVRKGLQKFIDLLKREISEKDIERLLAIPIRRISRFDINKNKQDIEDILDSIVKIQKDLDNIIGYSIKYINSLIERFAVNYPRRTLIEEFKKVDKKAAALNNIKVGWDRKNCYIGSSIKAVESLACNEYDNLICIEKTGSYKIINIPLKMYIGRLYYFNKHSENTVFCLVYKDKKKGIYYVKRCCIDKFIRDKEYMIIPENCQLELITNKDKGIYECKIEMIKGRKKSEKNLLEINFSQIQMRAPAARGFRFTDQKILKFKYKGQSEDNISTDDEDADGEKSTLDVNSDDAVSKAIKKTIPIKDVEDVESIPVIDSLENCAKEETEVKTATISTSTLPEESDNDNRKDEDKDSDWGIIQPGLGF